MCIRDRGGIDCDEIEANSSLTLDGGFDFNSIWTVSYTHLYQLTVSGNADRDTLSQIEKLLNEGDNAKNIWTHAWICMHDACLLYTSRCV